MEIIKVLIAEASQYLPHDAITGSVGCLVMDLILPEHLPTKDPNNFPGSIYSYQQISYTRKHNKRPIDKHLILKKIFKTEQKRSMFYVKIVEK